MTKYELNDTQANEIVASLTFQRISLLRKAGRATTTAGEKYFLERAKQCRELEDMFLHELGIRIQVELDGTR